MTSSDRNGQDTIAHDTAAYDARDDRAQALLTEMKALPEGDPRRAPMRAEIVQIYTPLARAIARRYAGRGEPLDDIEQAVMVGLVKAINRYDPALGGRFLAYANPTMTGEVKRHFRDRTWRIRVPRVIQERRIALHRASRDFATDHSRSPTVPELASLLGLSDEQIIEVLAASHAYQPASLDSPVSSDGEEDTTLGDLLGADDDLDLIDDRLALRPLLSALPDRERGILLLRYFGNKTQAEIADLVGLSQMHVSRLIRRTLDQLHTALLTD